MKKIKEWVKAFSKVSKTGKWTILPIISYFIGSTQFQYALKAHLTNLSLCKLTFMDKKANFVRSN